MITQPLPSRTKESEEDAAATTTTKTCTIQKWHGFQLSTRQGPVFKSWKSTRTSWKLSLRSANRWGKEDLATPWLQKIRLHVKEKPKSQTIQVYPAKVRVRLSPCPQYHPILVISLLSLEKLQLYYIESAWTFQRYAVGFMFRESESKKAVLVALTRVVGTLIDQKYERNVNRTRNITFWSGVRRATITPWILMVILKYLWESNSGPLVFPHIGISIKGKERYACEIRWTSHL